LKKSPAFDRLYKDGEFLRKKKEEVIIYIFDAIIN